MSKKSETPDDEREAAEREAAAVWFPIAELKPWSDNPRQNEAAIEPVIASMKRFGFGAPILARKSDREIIAGHTRLKAALKLGFREVPVRFLDLDPADAHLLALADNKLGELAEWDDGKVAEILSRYGLDDAALAGWEEDEIDKLAKSFEDEHADASSRLDGVRFQIVVECEGETQQTELLTRFESEGLTCRPLMS